MIEFHEIDGRRLIRSIDLYPLLGCNMTHYSRWARKNILEQGVIGFDYFPSERNRKIHNALARGPKSDIYYVTIDFAKALCLVVKTPAAKRTRLMLYTI